jgi:FKBP12-rapamycin complex-associated protein
MKTSIIFFHLSINVQHRLYFSYLKHLWATGNREGALFRLDKLCGVVELVSHFERSQNENLRAACWCKLGDWTLEKGNPPLNRSQTTEVLFAYKRATAAKQDDYKAWHAWALMNFRLAQSSHEFTTARPKSLGIHNNAKAHILAAVQGFVKAISYGTKRWSASVQQDMLNLLTCLFRYGEWPEVAEKIEDGLSCITLEAWLGVLPQLLARIQIKSPSIRKILHNLLRRLGSAHPQAMMYPLSVLLKSPIPERKAAANSLMNSLKAHSYDLVEHALLVSSELIRVAILWLELWHEGLEDASRLYFGEGNVSGMLDVLLPLHEQIEKGPSTLREQDFLKSFGRDLAEAHSYLKEYMQLATSKGGIIPTQGGFNDGQTNENPAYRRNAEAEAALNQAWDLYYTVFRRINKQIPSLTKLELSSTSPSLMNAKNLELGVPGSYRVVDGSYVKIEQFGHSVQVITSKQRPRKILLKGNDGKDYIFLLKAR